MIPKEKKEFVSEEAVRLRKVFVFMGPIHFCLIFADIFAYDVEVMALLADIFFVWLNFFNYMSLNKLFVGTQLAFYLILFFVSLTHFQRVAEAGEGAVWIFYIL